MKNKLLALMLAIAMIVILIPAITVSAADDIALIIDGETVVLKTAPVKEGSTVLVPLSALEYIGARATYNATHRQYTISTAANKIVVALDSAMVTVNDDRLSPKNMGAKVKKLQDGTVLVPLRAFDALGAKTSFSASAGKIEISYFNRMKGTLKVSGSTTVQPIAQAAADKLAEMNKELSITVSGGGSGTGINDAKAGTVNIGMSSREFTDDELRTLTPYAVANDGIAVIVHPSNPVKNLTKAQASKIFLGEIKNWKEVGGNDAPIMVMTRETGSGTLSTLIDLLLGSGKTVVSRATPFTSSTLIKQAVAKNANAIGFDSIGFVDATVKAVSLDGIDATADSVISGKYAMGRSLYVCTRGKASSLAAMYIDFLRSTRGQEIAYKEGYIKLG